MGRKSFLSSCQMAKGKVSCARAVSRVEPRKFTSLAEVREVASKLIRDLRASREPTSTSPTLSFNSAPETFDSNENTPQSGNSHSVLTPEVAMYCGALQFE